MTALPQPEDPSAQLEAIRALRDRGPKFFLTDDFLAQARREGRP